MKNITTEERIELRESGINETNKEEKKMERIPTELELLSQLMGNLNNKEEETMNGEVKDLETGHIERAFIIDQGDRYLVKPYMLESSEDGEVSHRYYASYALAKELEGFEYEIYLQEEEETKMKMDLQFFANKIEEESVMLEQIEKFKEDRKSVV